MIVSISEKEFKKVNKTDVSHREKKTSIEDANKRVSKIAFILVAIVVAGTLAYWLVFSKKKKEIVIEEPVTRAPTIEEIFNSIPVGESIPAKDFYTSIYNTT